VRLPDRGTDYDLHGIVGIRLIDATPSDVAAVDRQLGPIRRRLSRQPDITIRFVERLPKVETVRLLGLEEAGFTSDRFLVLRSKHKWSARVQVRFEQIGGGCEIVCESGLLAVPLLIPILNLTALANGALPLHAAAFSYNDTGILTTGWSKGGKTETLLAFMSRGARYVGDEWIYISNDGTRMFGIPEPIRVWDWHLDQLPHYRALVGPVDRTRLRLLRAARAVERIVSRGPGGSLPHRRLLRRAGPLLARQSHVDMHPKKLFGRELGPMVTRLQKVFLVGCHDSADVRVRALEPREVAERMVFSLQYERLPFMSWYYTFRFAFPEARSELIESTENLQRERLLRVLADKEAFGLDHPYPVRIASLFDAMEPLI
jgi:hypothetical protein